ncbi:MAG: hypothetical protein ACJ749_17255 [Flavisolibacter sp.]
MALTSWAVSYFRSLKRTKVLALLTKYLVQYKRVSIPHIGTFEIIQQSPELKIADKLITPPSFITRYVNNDRVPEHQVRFIASSEHYTKETLEEELSLFGENLKNRIQNSPFSWNGFGTLRYASSELVFDPQQIQFDSLQFMPAVKIMRENAQHRVLVGDRQMISSNTPTESYARIAKRPGLSLEMFIGLIILLLAVALIIYLLFIGNFEPAAAGLRLKP